MTRQDKRESEATSRTRAPSGALVEKTKVLEISSTRSTGARLASAATPPHTAQHLHGHGVSLTGQRYAMHRTAQTHHQGAPPHAHTERNVPRCPMTNTGRSPWCQPEALWTPQSPTPRWDPSGCAALHVDAPEGFALR